jgi:lysophospholipase L1-like esterase
MTRALAALWGARIALLFFALCIGGCAGEAIRPPDADMHWVSSWGSAQMVPDEKNLLSADDLRDASLRQVVRVSLGGKRLRVRVSNVYGTAPLVIEAASIAKAVKPGLSSIDPASLRSLTFAGKASVMIPAGSEYYTDPISLEHSAKADLAVSLHFKEPPARQTGHPGSRTTTYMTRGNRVSAESWPEAAKFVRWYQLADIEVEAPRSVPVVVAIGDSITDGAGSTTDGNDRWTDALVLRMEREGTPPIGVVNAGIGGNRLLRDGLGPHVVSRFDRDVLARSGVTHAIVLIGVNDFGIQHRNGNDTPAARAELVEDMQFGYRQLVERAHAHGVCVIGATIVPYTGSDYYKPNAENEKDRQQVNQWIRTSGVFDAIADFDAATRDPVQPERMRKEHDSGDGLHPSPAGFVAMADAVPLEALRTCRLREARR